MADVVGLVLSIREVVQMIYDYGKSVREAENDRMILNSELFALQAILDDIRTRNAALFQTPNFRDMLVSIKTIVTKVLGKLLKSSGKTAQAWDKLKWPFKAKDVEQLMGRLQRLKQSLMLSMMTETAASHQDLHETLRRLCDDFGDDREERRQLESSKAKQELREWLAGPFDPRKKQDETWNERLPDTGQWFLQSREFQTWLEGPDEQTPRILNVIGKSGAGKTSLMSSAIKAAQSLEKRSPQIAVAYYYCSFNEAASQDPANMVGSFISQVSLTCPDLLEGLESGLARRERPTIKDLEQRFELQSARSSVKILLLVDAVNECKQIGPMIDSLLRLVKSASEVRVLFTNTVEDPLITTLAESTGLKYPKATVLRMPPMKIDIDLFIEAKIGEKKNLQKLPRETREEIKGVLSSKANGTFRWVQCQIEHLGNQSTGKMVKKALRELPSDLNATYTRILARIPKDNQGFAREALLWLSFAYRPLTLLELSEPLAFKESHATVKQRRRLLDTHDLLSWCQGLITYDPDTSYTALSHSSVRTYLLSNQIKNSDVSLFSIDKTVAETLLLRKCLRYVMFKDFSQGYCLQYHEWEAMMHQWPLLSYASRHWVSHAYALDPVLEPKDQDLIANLCRTSTHERGGNFGFWVQCLYPKADIKVARDTQPLYYAASFGLRVVVSSLLSVNKDLDLEALGGRHDSTALQVACFRGHYGVAKDLLDAGANPYHRDGYGRSPLFYVFYNGDKDIADLLVQHLQSRTSPKGERSSDHIREASAAVKKATKTGHYSRQHLATRHHDAPRAASSSTGPK